jgi:alcohol dehydrogenase class IV
MFDKNQEAIKLIKKFKGDQYVFGIDCIDELGTLVSHYGKKVSVVFLSIGKQWSIPLRNAVDRSLHKHGLSLAGGMIEGARPNAPKEDVFRIAESITAQNPEVVVTVGGGSSIDATKAAIAYLTFKDKYPNLEDYFGMGNVTKMLEETNRNILPEVAVQVTSGSAAHLTKYSNITDITLGQKLLIIDMAIVPPSALFDYRFTSTSSADLTMDGGLDGISHCLEVLMGIPDEKYDQVKPVSLLGIDLIVNHLKDAVKDPGNLDAREGVGLGTDLGGYAIMLGGTNGAHLNSFSMTDILSHGRACALMNPYYVVFFAPAIENRLRDVGKIYQEAGYISVDTGKLSGKDLGIAVAEGMLSLSEDIGFPVALSDVDGFTEEHISRCLNAAKNPKLASKLQNMPVPLSAESVEEYMGPILDAAKTGELRRVKNMV